MVATVVLDFLSDPMGGLLSSARAFLKRVRDIDPDTHLVVLEEGYTISRGLEHPEAFQWVHVPAFRSPRALRRVAWQNLSLPPLLRSMDVQVYVSLSHYLPVMLGPHVRSVVGISNLAPFSDDAMAAEVRMSPKWRLRMLRRTIISSASRADRVVALSHVGRGELLARGISADKITVVPNGVDPVKPTETGDARETLMRLGVKDEFILCVSHFYRYKNYARLVEAYARLSETQRMRYPLVLVGAPHDAKYLESIRELVTKHRLDTQVRILPGVYGAELSALYRTCRLFVFPSLIENSPITLLEAMAHGAPVAAADIPAMREFGGDVIEYFDPHSEADMAQVLASVLQNSEKQEVMREAGTNRAMRYTWEAFTAGLVGVYRELLD